MKGMHVLDVGCNAGFFSLAMKKLGANYVLGIDSEHYIRQAMFLRDIKKIEGVDFKVDSIYRFRNLNKFNLTLCLGLLYHLKHPFLALKKISECTSNIILVETEALVDTKDTNKIQFIEHNYRDDWTNWWIFGEECLKGMLRSVGFKYVMSYAYPDNNPIFGKGYAEGLTGEGIQKGKRIILIGLKSLEIQRVKMDVSESIDLDAEINLKELNLEK